MLAEIDVLENTKENILSELSDWESAKGDEEDDKMWAKDIKEFHPSIGIANFLSERASDMMKAENLESYAETLMKCKDEAAVLNSNVVNFANIEHEYNNCVNDYCLIIENLPKTTKS